MGNKTAPIVIFVYKRVDKVKTLLESLNDALFSELTDVFVYSDGFKNNNDRAAVEEVRDYLKSYKGKFRSFNIVYRDTNIGLARSIISGVSEVIDRSGRVIVLEDDLIVSEDFIQYMNDALDYYEDDLRYGMISSYTTDHECLKTYSRDIYCMERGDCWGWATWKNRWEGIDWELNDFEDYLADRDRRRRFAGLQIGLEEQLIMQHTGRLDAWAARWIFHLFNQHMLTVYPKVCRTINIGFDGSGTNCGYKSYDLSRLNKGTEKCRFEKLSADYRIQRSQLDLSIRQLNVIKRIIYSFKYR